MRQSEKDVRDATIPSVTGVVTKQRVSQVFAITPNGSRALRVDIKVSAVTVAGGITAIVQVVNPAGAVDTKSVAITAAGEFSIKFLDTVVADQTYLPLAAHAQIVLTTTNALDSVHFDSMIVTQGDN